MIHCIFWVPKSVHGFLKLFKHGRFFAVVLNGTILKGDWGNHYDSPLIAILVPWSTPHKGFANLPLLLALQLFPPSHHMHPCHIMLQKMPLSIHTKIIFVIAEFDEIFPILTLQGSIIKKTVNLSKNFQCTRKKVT
jgi:hypothetical protein